jgi:general secretion pathway protein K
MSLGQQVWLRQAQNFNDRAQAEKVADGALQLVLQLLQNDSKDSSATDDLSEAWAQPLPAYPAADGTVTGTIHDAQGQFNLNDLLLADGINASTPDVDVYRRLLVSLSLNPEPLIASLLDWIDSNDTESPGGGAEDVYYLTLQPPYRPANHLLSSVDELRLVRGYDAKTVERLRPYVSALPERTALNINTVKTPELLSTLFATLPVSTARQLLDERDKNHNPFKTKEDLVQRAGQPLVVNANVDVKTAYFDVVIYTQFGHLLRGRRALIHRTPDGKTGNIVWQENFIGSLTAAAGP